MCSNTLNVIGLLNPTFGNTSQNIVKHHDDDDNKDARGGHRGYNNG